MTELHLASTQADARAIEAVEQHHATIADALRLAVEAVLAEAVRRDAAAAEAARRDLVIWCDRELLPHAQAEEQAIYPPAHATIAGRLLIEGMLRDQAVMSGLVEDLRTAVDPVHAAATAAALRTVFESHLDKANTLVLPLLASDPSLSVAELLGGMHELLGNADSRTDSESGTGGAGTGEADTGKAGTEEAGEGSGEHGWSVGAKTGLPELDVRAVPQQNRHATVLAALESVAPGAGVLLIAPHNPMPLLRQIDRRWPGRFEVAYLQRGPEVWRLELVRT